MWSNIEYEKKEMTPIKKIMDNKIISGIVIAIFGLLMAWGISQTNKSFKAEKAQEVSQKVIENVCTDVEELKKDTKEIRIELKEQREMIHKGQEKIFERLGSIHKSMKTQAKGIDIGIAEKASKEEIK